LESGKLKPNGADAPARQATTSEATPAMLQDTDRLRFDRRDQEREMEELRAARRKPSLLGAEDRVECEGGQGRLAPRRH